MVEEIVAFLDSAKRCRQLQSKSGEVDWPNSQGAKPRTVKRYFRLFWRLGAWPSGMPKIHWVQLDRSGKPKKEEHYDFFNEIK